MLRGAEEEHLDVVVVVRGACVRDKSCGCEREDARQRAALSRNKGCRSSLTAASPLDDGSRRALMLDARRVRVASHLSRHPADHEPDVPDESIDHHHAVQQHRLHGPEDDARMEHCGL